jgi:dUTP pyrophosphatase
MSATCDDEITMPISMQDPNDVLIFDEEHAKKCEKYTRNKTLSVYSAKATEWLDEADVSPLTETVKIRKIRDSAMYPTRASEGAAGYDVYAPSKYIIQPNEIVKIPLGFAISPPPGMYTRIADRSSLASQGLVTRGGVIDRDYTGDVTVCFQHTGPTPISIRAGSRIAQLIFEKNGTPFIEAVTALPATTRGSGGFGSTNHASRTQTYRINDDKLILTCKRGNYLHAKTILAPAVITDDSTKTSESNNPPKPKPNQDETRGATPMTSVNIDASPKTPISDFLEQTTNLIADNQSSQDTAAKTKQYRSRLPRVDNVNSALPKVITLSQNKIRLATGFTKSDRLIKNMGKVGQPTVRVSNSRRNPSINPGETASMRKISSTKIPATPTTEFSEKWHMDIVYGPCTAIGGITHGLYCVESTTRTQMIFPLKNLTDSLVSGIRRFLRKCGRKPDKLYTDFDPKLILGDVAKYLEHKEIEIIAAPPDRQDQNSLSEGNWETCVNMCRNWLRAQLLPAKFWWFGIKRSVEIQNIMPIYVNGKLTTPHELLHGTKVDYRCLFPMFSTAYIRKP